MGYTTNLTTESADFVIGAYHQLWRIEKSFRMSKHDLQARPSRRGARRIGPHDLCTAVAPELVLRVRT
jgi:hypothetical protein